jgi:hypothetical protein
LDERPAAAGTSEAEQHGGLQVFFLANS